MLYNCLAVTVRNDRVYQGNRFQFSTTTAVAAAAAIIIIISIPYRLSRTLLLLLLLINYYLCEFLLFSLPYTPEGSGPNHGPRAQQG